MLLEVLLGHVVDFLSATLLHILFYSVEVGLSSYHECVVVVSTFNNKHIFKGSFG
jgi:hypothetical protein